jgi:hypothetical protein
MFLLSCFRGIRIYDLVFMMIVIVCYIKSYIVVVRMTFSSFILVFIVIVIFIVVIFVILMSGIVSCCPQLNFAKRRLIMITFSHFDIDDYCC